MDAARQRPKVCYIVTSAVSTVLLRGQLARVKAAGFDVTIIATPGHELEPFAHREGVDWIPVPMCREISPVRDLLSLWRLVRVLARLKPDVVNASTPKAGLLGMLAATIVGVQARVYVLRGLRLDTTFGLKRRVLWLSEWLACRLAHKTVCISPSLRESAVSCRIVRADDALVIGAGSSNGIDADSFLPVGSLGAAVARKTTRQQWGLGEDDVAFGVVGRITRDKGIEEVVKAFDDVAAESVRVRLVLIGAFEDGDPISSDCRGRIESDPRILATGFLQNPAQAYAAIDVLVHPSVREGFGNAPAEGSASGLPVIGRRVTGVVDAVQDGVTGILVDPAGHESLTSAMLTYLRSPEVAKEHGKAGRKRIVEQFAPEQVWRGLINLYNELLHCRGTDTDAVVHSSHSSKRAA